MEKSNKFQTTNVILISLTHFIHDVYGAFLAPILPLLIDKLKINYTLASLLAVFQQIPSLINPIIGILTNNLKIKYLVILAPAITTVSMSLIGLAPNYAMLAILLFVMGLSSAVFHVPTPVIIKSVSGNRIGKGMSFYMLGGEGARTIGPLIIIAAVSAWGLEGTYKLIPFGLIASFILYIRLKNLNPTNQSKNINPFHGIKDVFKSNLKFFVLMGLIMFFQGFMRSSIATFLPTYLKIKGLGLWFGGVSLSIYEFAGAIGIYLAGSFSDKTGRMRMLAFLITIAPFIMILFVFSNKFFILPVLLLLGLFLLSSTPVFLAMVMDIKSDHSVFLSSIFMFLSFVSTSITAFLAGTISDRIGLINMFKIAALISFLAIPIVFILRNHIDKVKLKSDSI